MDLNQFELEEKIRQEIEADKKHYHNVVVRMEEIQEIVFNHDCKYDLKGDCECFALREELKFLEKEAYPSKDPCQHPIECVVSELSEWEQWAYCELCEERLA